MSLTSPIPSAVGIAHSAVGLLCFFCGRPCRDPAVYWAGETGEIYLHSGCVAAFVGRLLQDLERLGPA